MGTHWVMLNLGTARAVSFSADLARARLDSLDRRFLLSGPCRERAATAASIIHLVTGHKFRQAKASFPQLGRLKKD